MVRAEVSSVRLAELVATLSLAADLGLGQPMEHSMRETVIGMRLADRAGVDDSDRVATYYLGLMRHVYCHADATEQAKWFGDDITFKAEGFESFHMNTPQMLTLLLRRLANHGTTVERAKRLAAFPRGGFSDMVSFMSTHTTLAAQFAERLGLDEAVQLALLEAYEQWDGKGPRHIEGEGISLASRLVSIAAPVEIYSRTGGVVAACEVARRHRGGQFDPELVDLLCAHPDEILDGLDDAADWDAILDAEPQLSRRVGGKELDSALEAMADLVDMKSPQFAGHSPGVANLAAEASRVCKLGEEETSALFRAGLIHDLGRLGVSNTIWDKPGPLTAGEMERVRLHPYLTERMLARFGALGGAREPAARHHERLDGSGYPRGLTAASLSLPDGILAAADAYHAMTEPRAHRPAHPADRASEQLLAEAKAGRLDGEAVNAVLTAAGHRAPARREWPSGLTAREVEVLRLVARGHTNREIAVELVVAPKTVSNHVEHIYLKIDASTRASATMFAIRQGLVGSFEPA